MDRRDFLKTSGLAGMSLAAAPLLKLSSGTTRPDAPATGQCLWGAFAQPTSTLDAIQSLQSLEQKVGRQFALHRGYQGMDRDLVGKDLIWLQQRGTIAYRSFHAWSGTPKQPISWAAIAAGKNDAWLKKQAEDLAAWDHRMYICFHHEPEESAVQAPPGCGTPDDFKRAYGHVRQIFAPAQKLIWVATLLSPTYSGHNGGARAWLPSSDQFDVLGVDGYNRYPCSGRYKSFADKFLAAKRLAGNLNKPLAIGEWGCVEQTACGHSSGDPLGKAKWIQDAAAVMKSWPRLIWCSWTHERSGPYLFFVDTSAASLAAFTTVGKDPYFQ
jgi:hypothetical protein